MIVPSIYPYIRKTGENRAVVNIMCYFKNGKRHFARVATGLKIDPQYWVESTKAPSIEFVLENGEWYETLKAKMNEVQLAFQHIYESLGDRITAQAVSDYFNSNSKEEIDIEREAVTDLVTFIRWYVKKQEVTPYDKRKSKGTIKQYIKIHNRLENYYKATKRKLYLSKVTMDDVDMCVAWFERQRKSNGELYSKNSIVDHEKWLIALVNKAVANKFDCKEWNPKQSEGRVSKGRTDEIHFGIEDLQKIMDYRPQNELEKCAVVFWVIGYCSGLRHSDWRRCYELLTVGHTNVGETISVIEVNGKEYRFLHMRPHKTRKQNGGQGIWCGIPVLKPVEEIISKHGLPRPAVDQVMNRSLKEVAVNAGIDERYTKKTEIAGGEFRMETGLKGEFATTHKVGRVSFITQFAEYAPKPVLVKVTGHVGGRRDAFDGYIKDYNLKRNSERFIGLLQHHQERGEFGEFEFV